MRSLRNILQILAAGAALVLMNSPAHAADTVLRGDEKCMTCHAGVKADTVLKIALRRHAVNADGRTPTCTTCHGASDKHMATGGSDKPDRVFHGKGQASSDELNATCLTCHSKDAKRSHWMGSMHQQQNLACASCHQIHTGNDKVLDRMTQPQVCFTCHKQQRTQVDKPSHHPILEGKVVCSDCHNPHGSTGPKLLKRDSVNDTCYTCHMEKRGPFVHNHEPVSEDCTLCHDPHGTTAENMLKARPPFLCHQCHTPHGGNVGQLPGQGQDTRLGDANPLLTATSSGKSGINYFMARGCTNCHTQVHGSNNPSTANPSPQFMFR